MGTAIPVLLRPKRLRSLLQIDGRLERLVLSHELKVNGISHLVCPEHREETAAVYSGNAVHTYDDVPDLKPGIERGSSAGQSYDCDPLLFGVEAQVIAYSGGNVVNGQAHERSYDTPMLDKAVDNGQRGLRAYREPYPLGLAQYGSVDPYNLAAQIHQRAAAVCRR